MTEPHPDTKTQNTREWYYAVCYHYGGLAHFTDGRSIAIMLERVTKGIANIQADNEMEKIYGIFGSEQQQKIKAADLRFLVDLQKDLIDWRPNMVSKFISDDVFAVNMGAR